jgi:hypothetical protein
MPKKTKEKKAEGVFKGVFMAYFILIFHLALLVGLGAMVLFFRGFIEYMLWIFLGVSALVLGSCVYFFLRLRRDKQSLGEALRSPTLRDRAVEISLLGGLASVRLGAPSAPSGPAVPMLENPTTNPRLQLEDPSSMRIRELSALARLLEDDLITREEYNKAKQHLFNSYS